MIFTKPVVWLFVLTTLLLAAACHSPSDDALRPRRCLYQGTIIVPVLNPTSPAAQVESDFGIFIFNTLNHTISLVTEVGISDIEWLAWQSPASACALLDPDFACNEIVCTVSVSNPDFWDCAGEEMNALSYRIWRDCLAEVAGPVFE